MCLISGLEVWICLGRSQRDLIYSHRCYLGQVEDEESMPDIRLRDRDVLNWKTAARRVDIHIVGDVLRVGFWVV